MLSADTQAEILRWVNDLKADLVGLSESVHQLHKCMESLEHVEPELPDLSDEEWDFALNSFYNWQKGFCTRMTHVPPASLKEAFIWGATVSFQVRRRTLSIGMEDPHHA